MFASRSASLVVTLFAAAVAGGAALLLLRALARNLLYPGSAAAFPSPDELARSVPGASLISYAAGGRAMTGALVRARGEGSPRPLVVVWFHGNGESAAGNLPFASALADGGFDVFLPEYRGYGGQRGSPTETGLYADGEAALGALARLGYPPERVVLAGRSLGTGVAAELAVRRPPALLLLVSPFTSVIEMVSGPAALLAPLVVADRFDTLSKIGRVRSPVAILHGARDEIVPVAMGRRIAAACRGARYVEVAEAGHNDFPGLPELILAELRRC